VRAVSDVQASATQDQAEDRVVELVTLIRKYLAWLDRKGDRECIAAINDQMRKVAEEEP
jgi:hypothetical protein